MRKLTVAFLLGLTSFVAHAQKEIIVEKPVFCSSLKIVIETITGTYQEEPFWRGADEKSKFLMTVNPKSGSWTMIQYNDQIACVLGVGNNSKVLLLGKTV